MSPASIAAQLKARGLLPSLQGYKVVFSQLGIDIPGRSLPIILWTSHQAFGERVSLYCRAGTTADNFVSARTVLAAACWAHDVAIFVDPRHTQLVILDVIRRRSDDLPENLEGNRAPDPTGGPPAWSGDHGT